MLKNFIDKFIHEQNNNKEQSPTEEPIPTDLDTLLQLLKCKYHYPINQDITIREIKIGGINKRAVLFFVKTIVDTIEIEESIVRPLIKNTDESKQIPDILNIEKFNKEQKIVNVINQINSGNTALFIDGMNIAFTLDTTKFQGPQIDRSETEITLKGPKAGFTEQLEVNINLVRKKILNENLVFESMTVSKRANNKVSIAYMKDLANEDVLNMVKERLEGLEVDAIQNTSLLRQHIEDSYYSIFPTILETERPDRVAAFISNGHVALLMENSPAVLIVPVSFWAFLHTPDDRYLHMVFGNFTRLLRAIALIITLFTSAAYVAITNYHAEMVPSDLLLAIAATREKVPFPAIVEVLVMELAFELIREAGLRVPSPIGPTIGIVGALILGQAASDANIVSPIVVIVVALSGLTSFIIGNISMNFAIRITRILFIIAAGLFGIYGMAALLTVGLFYLTTLRSFDVPYFAPLTPKSSSPSGAIILKSVQSEYRRPQHIKPKDTVKK